MAILDASVVRSPTSAIRPSSPLASGWLSGAIREGRAVTTNRSAMMPQRFDTAVPANRAKMRAVEQLARVADQAGLTMIQLALAFVTAHPAVTSAIIGPRTMDHLHSQLAAADTVLSADVLDAIDHIVASGVDLAADEKSDTRPLCSTRHFADADAALHAAGRASLFSHTSTKSRRWPDSVGDGDRHRFAHETASVAQEKGRHQPPDPGRHRVSQIRAEAGGADKQWDAHGFGWPGGEDDQWEGLKAQISTDGGAGDRVDDLGGDLAVGVHFQGSVAQVGDIDVVNGSLAAPDVERTIEFGPQFMRISRRGRLAVLLQFVRAIARRVAERPDPEDNKSPVAPVEPLGHLLGIGGQVDVERRVAELLPGGRTHLQDAGADEAEFVQVVAQSLPGLRCGRVG
ncbi:hypothetical protein ABIB25_005858 [Nakamurella sp. UYEF19]